MVKKPRGLGRGLDALLPSNIDVDEGRTEIEIDRIRARKEQPRRNFDEESLQELAESIKEHGVLQPVLLRPAGEEYELVAGERRWRAAQMAGLTQMPAVIKDMDDTQAAEIALIENIQRDDLTVIEEALGYKNLIDRYGYTQESLAGRVGKSRSHIANCLRLLMLPAEVLHMVEQGQISGGHARALLALPGEKEIKRAAQEVAAGKLSVRDTEARVRNKKKPVPAKKSVELKDMEQRIEEIYGTRAEITRRGKGGKIEISFYDREDLERILELMGLN